MQGWLLLIELIFALCFTGLFVYSLVRADTDDVRTKCPKLWEFLLARLVATIITCVVAGAFFLASSQGLFGLDYGCVFSSWSRMSLTTLLVLLYFGCFFIAGAVVVPANFPGSNSDCSNSLGATMNMNFPLLAILGWVNMIIDGLVMLGAGVALGYELLFSSGDGFGY